MRVNMVKVGLSLGDHIWAMATIAHELAVRSGLASIRNAVIVWPYTFGGPPLTPAQLVADPMWSEVISIIKVIHQHNGVIVVPSGDGGSNKVITQPPAIMRTSLAIPLVVVGAVDLEGNQEPYAQSLSGVAGDETIWAVGEAECSRKPRLGTQVRGTAVAAAAVGGFLAAILANFGPALQPLVNDPARLIMDRFSRQRLVGGPRAVIWNLLDGYAPDPDGARGNATGLAQAGVGDDGPALVDTT